MKLEDFLDSYIVMKNITGSDWTFWEKDNSKLMISYCIETEDKIEIDVMKLKSEDLVLLSIYFPDSKNVAGFNASMWQRNYLELKHTYSMDRVKGRGGTLAVRMRVGVKDIEELKKFFDNVF